VSALADALLVPNRALRFVPPDATDSSAASNDGYARVWVLDGGAAVPVPIRIGLSDGEMTEVLEGDIDAGTEVIIDVARPRREKSSNSFFG
jgi:HlyD family secretion protein